MKNLIIIIAVFFASQSIAQDIRWIPSTETDEGCTMITDCKTNTMCYSLEYTPEATGILTSYTSAFISDCLNGKANVLHNQSCVIDDNSILMDGCTDHGKMLIGCSGNTGELSIVKEQPVILHQVCFEMNSNDDINLELDPVSGFTVSYDIDESNFGTSLPEYQEYNVGKRAADSPCDEDVISNHVFEEGLSVYPNPSTGNINLYFDDGGQKGELSITNSTNQRLMTQMIDSRKEQSIDLTYLTPGSYIALVKGERSTLSTKFIIIK